MASQQTPHVPTSAILSELLADAPSHRVTLGWLIESLGHRAFGVILLLLALLGLLPGVSVVAGLLLVVLAYQMAMAHPGPIFPRRISSREINLRRITPMVLRTIPILRRLERVIHPRWAMPFEPTKRVVGVFVLVLGLGMLIPIPLSNIPPALVAILVAFAYLEKDGALLCVALCASLVMLAFYVTLVWETVDVARWLVG
jgi:hypothetical protein